MDVFAWGKQQSDREEEHNGTSGWFRPCRGCTENSRSHHWSPDKRRRTRGEGGREGARGKNKNKCHYWFGEDTEQASADLQLTAAATRNKKKEEKQKAASDCDPGVNMCSSH